MDTLLPLIIILLMNVGIVVLIIKLVRNYCQNNQRHNKQTIEQDHKILYKQIEQIIQDNNEIREELKYLKQQIENISKTPTES